MLVEIIVAICVIIVIFCVLKKKGLHNVSTASPAETGDAVKENYSYSFGFPTWGSVDNRVHGLLYNSFLWRNPYNVYNPYRPPNMPYVPYGPYGPIANAVGGGSSTIGPRENYTLPYQDYFFDSIAPYLSNRCYSANKQEDCVPGYSGVRVRVPGSKKHSKKHEFKCCRYGF